MIIKYQNCLLLKKIAEENNWEYEELKKTYLKNKMKEEKILNSNMKSDFKICKRIKLKIKKKNCENCYKYNYLNEIYYINPKNNNTYNKLGEFIGIKEEDIINFDMEEAE